MLVPNENAKSSKTRVPLRARPMDLLYFTFFACHLVASILIDLQWLYPPSLVPKPLRAMLEHYVQFSGDPLVGGLAGIKDASTLLWFKVFISLEGAFQVPVFVLGLVGLWNGCKKIYPLLVIYAASSATTTLPCIAYILSLPEPTATTTALDHALTFEQRLILLSSYIPFFLIPLTMVFDFAIRLQRLVAAGVRAERQKLE